jgi:hypothetical protein
VRTSLYLKTQAELLAEIEGRMTDTGNALATDAQYHAAINEAIRMWGGRVVTPQIHELTGSFSSGTYEYTLPSYIRPPFRLQIKASTYAYLGVQVLDDDNNYTWHDLVAYEIEPTAAGGFKLRLATSPMTEGGRIIWYAENAVMPTTAVTLTSTINAAATSIAITVSGPPDIGSYGNIKIENEWLSYSDVTRTSATSYTLTGCVRGLYGTVAASHNSAVAVVWGVAVDDPRLWVQMYDYVAAYIHAMQLHKSTIEDMGRHEKLMSYYQQKADSFWRKEGYVSQRSGRMRLTGLGIGGITW